MHLCLLLKKYIQDSQHWFSHSASSTHKDRNLSWKGTEGLLHVRNTSYKSQQFLKLKILAPCSFVCVGYIVNIGHPLCWKQYEWKGKSKRRRRQRAGEERCARLPVELRCAARPFWNLLLPRCVLRGLLLFSLAIRLPVVHLLPGPVLARFSCCLLTTVFFPLSESVLSLPQMPHKTLPSSLRFPSSPPS